MIPKRFLSLLVLAAGGTVPADAQVSDNPTVQFRPSGDPGRLEMTISDPANRGWDIQFSTDLRTWHPYRTVQVYNGSFAIDLRKWARTPQAFFRANHDPALPPLGPTVGDALLLPTVPDLYSVPLLPPSFFFPPILEQDNTPPDNFITDTGATLGRVLFYDKRLSANNSVSCSSCHQQAHGFSDPRRFSVGFAGGKTRRNSMGLTNARYYQNGRFMWDEQAATLEEQVLHPIQDPVEMGLPLTVLVEKLSAEPFYHELFTSAFGDPSVSSDRISRALAQFIRSIVSNNSQHDQAVRTGFANVSIEEHMGRYVFTAHCAVCHESDNFVPGKAMNIGLENPYTDPGVGGITGKPEDLGAFKSPSLRNIALTAPYMHDGRFATLRQVIEFYNSGVVAHPNLAPELREFSPDSEAPIRLHLSEVDKDALEAFLRSLTDYSITTDPRFADPFNYGDGGPLPGKQLATQSRPEFPPNRRDLPLPR